jgi:hypothetical protein
MNERIWKLAEQATKTVNVGGMYEFFDKEKFAELIVRECIDIADEYDGVGSTIVSRIREHFGVK